MKGVLLVNLGTPDAPTIPAVYKYLIEFLTDPRVIDLPWLKRQLLVHAAIVPFRVHTATRSYQTIWTKEGSPLMVYGKRVKTLLQAKLGANFHVELAMRYQSPTIESALQSLLSKELDELIVIPLFPQYASATTGSIFSKLSKALSLYPTIPKLTFLDQFHSHPAFIEAFRAIGSKFNPTSYDHVLFSFHGLPMRQLKKANPKSCCTPNCCQSLASENRLCYAAQCYATGHALAKALQLPAQHYSICFQSRLGNDPWITPFTNEQIVNLATQGKKRVLVFCPAFVADCLETLFEIGIEYRELFQHAGGETLDLVPSLNDHPLWIEALESIIK